MPNFCTVEMAVVNFDSRNDDNSSNPHVKQTLELKIETVLYNKNTLSLKRRVISKSDKTL